MIDECSFIGGGVLGVIGTIICATANSIICGIANATQLSFHIVMGELVPMKHRYMINAVIYGKPPNDQVIDNALMV